MDVARAPDVARAALGRDASPRRPPYAILAWRNWLLTRSTTTTFARARFFHFLRLPPQRSRRRRAPTSEPLGRDASPTRPRYQRTPW